MQYYLPPYPNFNKDYLKKVLNGQKGTFRLDQIKPIKVPLLAELNVKDLWLKYKEMPEVNRYLPDRVPKGRQLDRTFFFNILNTVAPEVVSKIIEHSLTQRNKVETELEKQETIQITPEW